MKLRSMQQVSLSSCLNPKLGSNRDFEHVKCHPVFFSTLQCLEIATTFLNWDVQQASINSCHVIRDDLLVVT
jgi:hypothetical protein